MNLPTLSDLNSPSLVPPLGVGKAPDLGPLAVMISTVPDVRYMKKSLGQPRPRPFFMGELFMGPAPSGSVCSGPCPQVKNPGYFLKDHGAGKKGAVVPVENNAVSFAGPFMGAPYAVMLLESLIARGVRQIIVIGWCGSISPAVNIGDILVPEAAISQEGTSRNYMDVTGDFPRVSLPSPSSHTMGLGDKFTAFLAEKSIPFKTGCIWTTDAIYRETAEKVAFFQSRGALAVEMECSALFAVAVHHGVELVSVLVVSDDLSGTRWKPAFNSNAFATARKQVADAVIEFCI